MERGQTAVVIKYCWPDAGNGFSCNKSTGYYYYICWCKLITSGRFPSITAMDWPDISVMLFWSELILEHYKTTINIQRVIFFPLVKMKDLIFTANLLSFDESCRSIKSDYEENFSLRVNQSSMMQWQITALKSAENYQRNQILYPSEDSLIAITGL